MSWFEIVLGGSLLAFGFGAGLLLGLAYSWREKRAWEKRSKSFAWVQVCSDPDYMVWDLMNPTGKVLARVESFSYAAYPMALNSRTGRKERGGAYQRERFVYAFQWAERVAGLRPAWKSDKRPPFYTGTYIPPFAHPKDVDKEVS